MFITFKRIIKYGFQTFIRNGFLSASSILVMTIALTLMLSVYFSIVLLQIGLGNLEKKVDINIIFKSDAPYSKVLEFKKDIEILSVIDKKKSILQKKDEVFKMFKNKHKTDFVLMSGLNIVDENPFGPILNIKATNIKGYKDISNFIESKEMQAKYSDIIAFTNYKNNKKAIERLSHIIDYVKEIGIIVSIFLVAISVIVTFNTMRLIIYTYKEEITVMRLVGASKFFARGPFIIEGMIYGIIAAFFTLFIFWAIVFHLSPALEPIFNVNVNQVFSANIIYIVLSLLFIGIMLGFFSTYLAVSRYLKV